MSSQSFTFRGLTPDSIDNPVAEYALRQHEEVLGDTSEHLGSLGCGVGLGNTQCILLDLGGTNEVELGPRLHRFWCCRRFVFGKCDFAHDVNYTTAEKSCQLHSFRPETAMYGWL